MGLTGHIYDAVPKCRGKDSMEEWLGPGGGAGTDKQAGKIFQGKKEERKSEVGILEKGKLD